MALRIRLRRGGKKKSPHYRIVVTERASSTQGQFLENVGTYDPLTDPATLSLKEDRVKHWLSKGATPSDTVKSILRRNGFFKQTSASAS